MTLKLTEIGNRIDVHLKRFERDPKINRFPPDHHSHTRGDGSMRPYWSASASRGGSKISVIYVSYQGASKLTREEAEAYLAWLDAGNAGQHWVQQREASE